MPCVRFGLVADIHHADLPQQPWNDGTFYRQAKMRFETAIRCFNERRVDFVAELGDFKDLAYRQSDVPEGEDSRDKAGVIALLKEVEGVFAGFNGPRYHVFGNHDNDILNKAEVTALCPNFGIEADRTYYSFVSGGVTFIVLDGNFNKDNEPYTGVPLNWRWEESRIPPEELAWLRGELAKAPGKVICFVHQRLDSLARPNHSVLNADEIRETLSASGKVLAVFQGHDHIGGFTREDGVAYYTLRGMVTGPDESSNSFAEVTVYPSGKVAVTGFGNARSEEWTV